MWRNIVTIYTRNTHAHHASCHIATHTSTSTYATGSLQSPTLQCFSPCILLWKQTEGYGRARPLNWLLLSELLAMASALFNTWLFHTQSHSSCKASQGHLPDIHWQAALSCWSQPHVTKYNIFVSVQNLVATFIVNNMSVRCENRSFTQSLLLMCLAIMLLMLILLNWIDSNIWQLKMLGTPLSFKIFIFVFFCRWPWLKEDILLDASSVRKHLKCLVNILHSLEFRTSILVKSKWVCVLYVDSLDTKHKESMLHTVAQERQTVYTRMVTCAGRLQLSKPVWDVYLT